MKKLFGILLLSAACGSTGGSGDDTATDSDAGSGTTTSDTTTGGTTSGGTTTGGVACEMGTPGSFSMEVDPGTWPSEPGVDDGYTDYTVTAECTVVTFTPGATGFVLDVACTDDAAMAHTLSITVTLDPVDIPPGLSAGDAINVTFIRDSWHDVTAFGTADWLSISEDGVLLFAAMDGGAEFLGFTPADIEDFWSPLTMGYGDNCADGRKQLDAELSGTHLLVPHAESGSLVTADGEYAVIVDTFTTTPKGPEYPSDEARTMAVVRKGP